MLSIHKDFVLDLNASKFSFGLFIHMDRGGSSRGAEGAPAPPLVAASIRSKGELGKKKIGEEENRERRG